MGVPSDGTRQSWLFNLGNEDTVGTATPLPRAVASVSMSVVLWAGFRREVSKTCFEREKVLGRIALRTANLGSSQTEENVR